MPPKAHLNGCKREPQKGHLLTPKMTSVGERWALAMFAFLHLCSGCAGESWQPSGTELGHASVATAIVDS